jgi:hypothetical protein
MKYKIILKTSHKHEQRIIRCMNTWLVNQDVVCATDIVNNLNIDQLSLSDLDTHGISSEEKTINMLNHIKDDDDYQIYDWFMFIDDDAILNVKMLNYILPFLDKTKVYGINMKGAYVKNKELIYPSGGAGYLISYDTIINNPNAKLYKLHHEDVAIGQYMKDNNISLENKIDINGKIYKINFNGWFPFQTLKKELDNKKKYSDQELSKLIISQSEQWQGNIMNHLTHHYIRSDILMNLIWNEFFQKWNESLFLSNSLI